MDPPDGQSWGNRLDGVLWGRVICALEIPRGYGIVYK